MSDLPAQGSHLPGDRADDRVGPDTRRRREHRRRRIRRHGRRAYIRSVYFLPSLATLGNGICGFAACYVAAFDESNVGGDPVANSLFQNKFLVAAYFILLAMVCDALDGRLARFTRHTTDFGGQLDSLADVVSFGFAPAFVALLLFKAQAEFRFHLPFIVSRLIWAVGAIYFSCAAIRLARFNVSNEHGEQHHFSFLGLPSPGAAGVVVGLILMQQDLLTPPLNSASLSLACVILLPFVVLGSGWLMVSNLRYPHLVNRYLRGRRSIGRLVFVLVLVLLLVVAHRYVIGLGTLGYALSAPVNWGLSRIRPRRSNAPRPPQQPPLPESPRG
jgi:CDP-diacylglycerol--serine O-phosphatidyltransferase